MINISHLLTMQLLLQSFPHQEITGLRSRLLGGQFSCLIKSGTSWECRFNSWVMISLWWMSGNNPFTKHFTTIQHLFLLMDVWKRLTFSKFWYSSWYHHALWKMLSALQQSFVCHALLCTHICVHKIILWICRHLDGEHFSSANQIRSRFHFLGYFFTCSQAASLVQLSASDSWTETGPRNVTELTKNIQ